MECPFRLGFISHYWDGLDRKSTAHRHICCYEKSYSYKNITQLPILFITNRNHRNPYNRSWQILGDTSGCERPICHPHDAPNTCWFASKVMINYPVTLNHTLTTRGHKYVYWTSHAPQFNNSKSTRVQHPASVSVRLSSRSESTWLDLHTYLNKSVSVHCRYCRTRYFETRIRWSCKVILWNALTLFCVCIHRCCDTDRKQNGTSHNVGHLYALYGRQEYIVRISEI